MAAHRRSSRFALLALGVLVASALSCGREITAPGGSLAGQVSLRPSFAGLRLAGQSAPVSVSGIVEFVRVRIVLLRANGDTAVNRVVEFPADSQSISLAIPVVLSATAPAEGESFSAALRFVNAAGDTVFSGGPIAVQARPLGAPPAEPPTIPVTYTGPGATAKSLTLSADTVSGRRGETKTLTATVRDAQGAVLSTVPIAYSSLDTAMATVGLTSGTVAFTGIRGQTRVVAQTLTGQADTATVLVFPVPTAIAFLPDATGQQTRQRDPFPKPAAVKVTAADGLPVSGTIIDFTVTRGKGTVSQAKDTTDANGIASVSWTAGDSVGTGELSARISGGTLTATVTGVQLNAGPTALRFLVQPTNVVAQDTMSTVSVVVLDAIQDTVRAFTGPVRLALAGGRAGATLLGAVKMNAVAGVARFTDLAVDRDGTGYTLTASLDSTIPIPAVSSTPFNVTPRPIGAIALLSGGGQQALFGTPFATPVIFQVRGLAGEAIRDVIVNFAATGGGTLSQVQDTSDALGQVSVNWTAGTTAGDVTVTATALGTSISGTATNRQGSAAPTALEFLSQPSAIAAGDTLPAIRVRVLNGLGLTITDYVGSAIMGLNGGTAGAVLMNNASGVAFSGGIAEFRGLSVDRAGSGYRLKAQVTSTSVVALSDSFAVAPAPPTALQVVSGNVQSAIAGAALTDSVAFRVVNRFAEGVASQVVTFAVAGGGSVSATSAVTDASGRVAVRWTTGLTGDQQLVATSGGLTATALAFIPQGLFPVSGAGQKIFHGDTATAPIVFRVVQANGSALRGIPVTFSATEGGGTVAPVNVVSDSLGEVRTRWTAGSAYNGDVAIKAEIPGMPSAFSIATVKQGTRNVTALRYRTQPTAIVAGDTLPTITIAALNGLGDTATTFTGALTLGLIGGPSDARLLGTTTVNAAVGIARFPALTVDRAATAYQLRATFPADTLLPAQLSTSFAVSAAPAVTLALTGGGGQTVPQGLTLPDSIVVLVKDRFGFGVSGATVTFAVRQGGGTVAPVSRTTDLLGRAATSWTAGLEGTQRLAVVTPGIDTLFVSATALASNGAPVLFASVTELAAPVGRPTAVTLFLSNPAPTPVPVTLSMGTPGIATWNATTATIPVGGTTLDLAVTGNTLGAVWAYASSSVGRDSVRITVDSATVRVLEPLLSTYVTDTVRTRLVLDRPAPVGGLTLTVTSQDPLRVLVAKGDGRGYLDEPAAGCMSCEALTDAGPSVIGPAGATTPIVIPAGEMVGHLVLLPIDSTAAGALAAEVTVTGPGIREQRMSVFTVAPRLDDFGTRATNPVLGVGQFSSGYIDYQGTDVLLRRDLPVRIRPLGAIDSTLVTVLDTTVIVPRGAKWVSVPRLVEGKAPGIARLLLTAPAFVPDTVALRVDPAALFHPYASSGTTTLAIDEAFDEPLALGSESLTDGKTWGALRRETTRVSITVANPTVLAAPASVEVLGSTALADIPLRGKTSGSTTVTFAAPGYAPSTRTYEVVGGAYGTTGATSVGVALIDEVVIYRAGGTLAKAVDWTVTATDTAIVRVLTPTVRMAAGTSGGLATVRVEGRRLGSTTLTFAGDGQTLIYPISTRIDVLDFWDPSLAGIVEADSIEREVLVYTGSVRPFAAPTEGRLRSSDPTTIVVTDSILRFRPDSLYAVGRIRTIGTTAPAAPVALTVSAPNFESSTAAVAPAPAKLHLLPVVYSDGVASPASGVIRVGRGLAIPLYVQRWTPTSVALPLTFTRQGTAAIPVTTGITIPAGEEAQLVRLRGGSVLGTDTLIVSAPGLRPDTMFVEVVPLQVTLGTGVSVAVEQRAEISAWTAARLGAFTSLAQRVGDSTLVHVVSLDTNLVKVEQDTLLFVPQADGAVRLGRLRGIAPGIARIRALRPGTTDTLAALDVTVERPALLRPFATGELVLGMQQRTDAGELFIERSHRSGRGLWVRLTSSSSRVATVPDSVLIPPDSNAVHFTVTAGDSVGGATITASADRHTGLTFPVTVTRARLIALTASYAGAVDEVSTGVETPVGVYAMTPAGGGSMPTLRAAGEDPAIIDYDLGGMLRATTVPIPVRLRVADATRATVLRDTTTIPVGEWIAKLPGLAGSSVGTTTLTIEDRRGDAFQSLLTTASTLKVTPAGLAFLSTADLLQVPFLGTLPAKLYVESRSTASRVVATLTALPTGTVNGIGLGADSLILRPRSLSDPAWTEGADYPCYDFFYGCFPKAPVALRGLALGTFRVVAEAPGHRPDTITVEVTGAQIVGPNLPGSLAVGDSVRVDLTFASSTGSPMALGGTPVPLTIATGTALQAIVGGVTSTAILVPANATGASFWLKGISAGPATVTVSTPNFTSFTAALTVR